MYVSVGNEVWVGTADHPAGPWRDANGGKPLIPRNFRPGFHMIDAEAFIDDDGQAYLYWGSGLNWVNGHCFVVKLKPDMVSFDGEVRDITPEHYFEGPFMLKRNGRYFLTSSWGNTTKDTYQVRYAVGDTPFGPFHEPEDKPLLATDAASQIISPGHHAIFREGGRDFILYHRQALPFPREGDEVLRQVAVDALTIAGDRMQPVTPTHEGADVPGTAAHRITGRTVRLTASSAQDPLMRQARRRMTITPPAGRRRRAQPHGFRPTLVHPAASAPANCALHAQASRCASPFRPRMMQSIGATSAAP
jgi:hypothetical protein